MMRLLRRVRGLGLPAPQPARPHHDAVGWNDSAGELFKGTDIVEYDDESSQALLDELFPPSGEPPAGDRRR